MTPEERALVTPDQFESWVRDVIRENPDRVNPTTVLTGRGGGTGCVYTSPADPSCHCLIGEVLARRDPEVLPELDSADNIGAGAYGLLVEAGYDPDVGSAARAWQFAADDTGGKRLPLPWREVPDAVERPPRPKPEA